MGIEDENENTPEALKAGVDLSPSSDEEVDDLPIEHGSGPEADKSDDGEEVSEEVSEEVDEFDMDEEEEEELPSRLSSIFQTQANVEDMVRVKAAEARARNEKMGSIVENMQTMFNGVESNFVVFTKSIHRKKETRLLQYVLFNKEVSEHTGVSIGALRNSEIRPLHCSNSKSAKIINSISEWLEGEGTFLENEGWSELDNDEMKDITFDSKGIHWYLHTLVEAPYPLVGGDGFPEEPDDGYVPDEEGSDGADEEVVEEDAPPSEEAVILADVTTVFVAAMDDTRKDWNDNPASKLMILENLVGRLDILLVEQE